MIFAFHFLGSAHPKEALTDVCIDAQLRRVRTWRFACPARRARRLLQTQPIIHARLARM